MSTISDIIAALRDDLGLAPDDHLCDEAIAAAISDHLAAEGIDIVVTEPNGWDS